MVVPLRSQARLWHSLLHWAYYGLFPPLAAAFVRPSTLQPFGPSTAHFASLRVLGAPAASRPSTAHCALRFAPCARHFSPSGLRTLASSLVALPASLGLLRAASPTGRALRAPLWASAASRPPISRCARRSSAQRLPCARGAVGVSRLRGCRLRGCRLRGCRFHRFRFGLRPSGINQCARIAIWHIHDIASAPYALRSGARLVHQDPHRLSLLRPAPRGKTLRPPPARRLQSSDTDSRSGWS